MKLRDIHTPGTCVFSFEFFPPKTPRGEEVLFKHIERLKRLSPGFFSMTYGAGGGTREKTVQLSRAIRDRFGVETVCHVTCVGQSRDEVRAVIRDIAAASMQNVMALRGDPPQGQEHWEPHPDGFHHADELVREIKQMGDFSIAVAGFPELHPESKNRESDLHFLKNKIDAGADLIVTQLFFDNEDFYRFDREVKAVGVTVPVVPGILPIVSEAGMRRMALLSKAKIPEALDRALIDLGGDEDAIRQLGIDYAAHQIEGLIDYGVPGIHIYCLNRATASEAIFKKLDRI